MGQTIAIVGASQDKDRFSNKAVRAWKRRGWTVIPVHPRHEDVEGLKAYPSIAEVPEGVDMASLYVPPQVGIKVLDELRAKGIRQVYVNPGAESDELLEKARRLGLETIVACSIRDLGEDPGEY
ncbi:MAG: CoA-binding protein [Candidatus Eisenbacteria bacterium]|nr:CoA-binding protein [Candidatus Eisenbacteria bacterium]